MTNEELNRAFRELAGEPMFESRYVRPWIVTTDGTSGFFTAAYPAEIPTAWSSAVPTELEEITAEIAAAERDKARAEILAAIQSCAPSDVPYSAAKHEWARLGKKELFAQILKAIDHLAADGTSAAPESTQKGSAA